MRVECRNVCQHTQRGERHMKSLIISQVFLKYYRYLEINRNQRSDWFRRMTFYGMLPLNLSSGSNTFRKRHYDLQYVKLKMECNSIFFNSLIISMCHSKHDITNIMLVHCFCIIFFWDIFFLQMTYNRALYCIIDLNNKNIFK